MSHTLAAALALSALVISPGVAAVPSSDREPAIAIARVTVVGIGGRASLPDATVLIGGRHVVAVGPSAHTPIPRGARVMDGRGCFVTPGLWDMHVHQSAVRPRMRAFNRDNSLPLFIAHGVTSVRDMSGDLGLLLSWRSAIAKGEIIGPRLVVTGEKLGSGPVVPGAPFPLRTAEDVRRSVVMLKAAGADFVKLGDDIDSALVPALADACDKEGIPFCGHVPPTVSAEVLSDSGMRTMEHLTGILAASSPSGSAIEQAMRRDVRQDFWARVGRRLALLERPRDRLDHRLVQTFDPARADALFARFARNRTWQTPTLRVIAFLNASHESLLRSPSDLVLRETSWPRHPADAGARQRHMYATLSGLVPALVRAGVGVLAGTDTPILNAVPGLSLHEELELLVDAGMSPSQALDAATGAAAEAAGAGDSGAVEPGRIADLLLLDADPSVDIRNTRRIRAVIAGGRVFERPALDALIDGVRAQVKQARISKPWISEAATESTETRPRGRMELLVGIVVVATLIGLLIVAERRRRHGETTR